MFAAATVFFTVEAAQEGSPGGRHGRVKAQRFSLAICHGRGKKHGCYFQQGSSAGPARARAVSLM